MTVRERAWLSVRREPRLALSMAGLPLHLSIAVISLNPPTRGDGGVIAVELSVILELLIAACLLAWAIFAGRTKPQQRYLRRLWPELVPDGATALANPSPARQS